MARKRMTKSSAPGTKRLPASAFAYPKKRAYPINTPKRARAALSYAARKDTSGSYPVVARKVRARYGKTIGTKGTAKKRTTRRGRKR